MKRSASRGKVAKPRAKRAPSRGSVAKKASGNGRRPSSDQPSRAILPPPPGYSFGGSSGALLVPAAQSLPVPASKIRRGLQEAKRQLDATLREVLETMTGAYEIKEIKLVASFSSDGKFLGFGIGGAIAMEITVCPSDY